MLLEYIEGMSFDDVLSEMDLLSMDDTRFFGGQVLAMLHYMHERFIIYRDLKPANIICDSKGYLKLIDMGTAKILNDNSEASPDETPESDSLERTYTILGTPIYMAPEITRGTGYSYPADYWSFGTTYSDRRHYAV